MRPSRERVGPRLIVFDWDGTLADSTQPIVDCLARVMGHAGLPPLSPSRLREVIGLGLSEALEQLLPKASEPLRRQLADDYRRTFMTSPDTVTRLFPGVRATIATLQRRGIWLGVATGKSRRGLERAFEESGLGDAMVFQRTADDCPSKPHPAMLEEIIAEAGLEASETLMVGDTDYDLLMARRARVGAIGVTTGGHGRERLEACGPLACLDRLSDLLDFLESPADVPSEEDRG